MQKQASVLTQRQRIKKDSKTTVTGMNQSDDFFTLRTELNP